MVPALGLPTRRCAIVSGAVHQVIHQWLVPCFHDATNTLAASVTCDWRKKDRFEVYSFVSEAVVTPIESVIHLVARGLTRAITWRKLAIYPRHRWLGVRGRYIAACVVGGVPWPVVVSVCEVLQLGR